MDYKVKLKIVKYNKSLQNLLNLSLFDYIFNGRYIIYETKIKGKEYNFYNGRLMFEGEYLNGKKNGKGKEYVLGKLIFDGEYLNGKKWNGKGYDMKDNNIIYKLTEGKGFIKEYDYHGKLKYEGEYLNGGRNWKGKKYNFRGDIFFDGEYINGERKEN